MSVYFWWLQYKDSIFCKDGVVVSVYFWWLQYKDSIFCKDGVVVSVLTGLWWCVCRVNDLLLKVNNLDTTNTERRHAEQALRKHSRALTLVRTEF